ncbi:competence type IV pilus minor pilin ComGG [Sporolactobacillus sp. KGMB 08714]|uniref:competence type IV pilus minor pilin ComGG n=1 Tax=Sporolactobacillus sp. KGMB 08714 TaxID=3064704 RepID=UPI002FBE077F
MSENNHQKGFMLPLAMILALILTAFVLHAVLLLDSDRNFFQASYSAFQLQQLRECALADINEQIQKKTLPEKGSFVYDKGTINFRTNQVGDNLEILFTIISDQGKETDQIVYSLSSGRPVGWLERTDP